MADHNCEDCGFRAKYDNNPKSLLGRLWRAREYSLAADR